jgi:hypothetical protein
MGEWHVKEILQENPWLIVIFLGTLVPLFGIVFGTVSQYLQKTRQAELDASLKHEMITRGMSAEEIRTVLEASSSGSRKGRCDPSQPRHA